MKDKLGIFALVLIFVFLINSGFAKPDNRENYIILTSKDLLPSAQLFYNLRKSSYNVFIITTESIGSNKPEDIRKYLKGHFNTGYLLIIGSESIIPRPDMYPSSSNHSASNNSPGLTETDLYYGLLNEDLDKDKDGFQGELFDDKVSIDPDLVVGRIPFDDNETVKEIFDNEVNFLNKPFQKAVLASSFISFPGETYQGAKIFNGDGARFSELLQSVIPCDTVTLGEKSGSFPSNFNCDMPLNKQNFYEAINDAGLVIWDAHGSSNEAFNEWWEDKNCNGIPDDGFQFQPFISSNDQFDAKGIFFSGSCLNENGKDNLGKSVLLKGGTVFIGSTEISFTPSYFASPDDGGSESIAYYFVKNLVQGDTVGIALYSSFEYCFNKLLWKNLEDPVEGSLMNIYGLNIYGDPAVSWKLNGLYKSKAHNTMPTTGIPISFSADKKFEARFNFDTKSDVFIMFPRHNFYIDSVSQSGAIIDNEFGIIRLNGAQGEVVIDGKIRGSTIGTIKVQTSIGEACLDVSCEGFDVRDVNFDGIVDAHDFTSIVESFGKSYMNEGFNEFCDLNFDHRINGADLFKFFAGD